MGNSQHKYIGNNEAINIIGNDKWSYMRQRLLRSGHDTIDYGLFQSIVRSRFEMIPDRLLQMIFRAFTSDFHQKIDVDSFISYFAVILSDDRALILRFVFRIYETDRGMIERTTTEQIIQEAYGDKLKGRYDVVVRTLDQLFAKKQELLPKEFELWTGRLDLLTDWIVQVLGIFFEPLPVNLKSLHRQYSSNNQMEYILNRHGISTDTYSALQKQYNSRFYDVGKYELTLNLWKSWVSPFYLNELVASIIFESCTDNMKSAWKFDDFADFCLVYGSNPIELRAQAVCTAFIRFAIKFHQECDHFDPPAHSEAIRSINPDFESSYVQILTAMIILLAKPIESLGFPQLATDNDQDDSSDDEIDIRQDKVGSVELSLGQNAPFLKKESIEKSKRRRSFSLSEAPEILHHITPKKEPLDHCQQLRALMESLFANLEEFTQLDSELQNCLTTLYQNPQQSSESYTSLIIEYAAKLPGFTDLSLTASCLFGVKPTTTIEEKAYINVLNKRYEIQYPSSTSCPHGPVGTEWHVISKPWLESWKKYVNFEPTEETPSSPSQALTTYSPTIKSSLKPGYIDNESILKTSASKALLHGLLPGHNFEVLPPPAFVALLNWYGRGPIIARKVSPIADPENGDLSSSNIAADIEYFPLSVMLVSCDIHGKVVGKPREMLFSKHAVIEDAIVEIARDRKLHYTRIRLWNYNKPMWNEQTVISPELTFAQANIQDGQTILVEVSLQDGSWPRAQLQTALDNEASAEEAKKQSPTATGEAAEEPIALKLNNGLIGLDNLGNTCYLNSSLQVLLHNKLLVNYFLRNCYKEDINISNKHGYKGRVANIFGKLVADLWSAKKKSISPRYVLTEIATLRDQFAGNEQHDAHELLTFLLDGLSEDLNLVPSKPYIENPDSDGRPDHELADIWWQNHLKRDRSFIQALFCGQFKSIMQCSCGYSSARFEPFTYLSVPIPEETHRVIMILVVPRAAEKTTRCAVRVPKNGTVADIVAEIKAMKLDGMIVSSTTVEPAAEPQEATPSGPAPAAAEEDLHFLIGEMHNLRIRRFIQMEKQISNIKESDLLVFFQVELAFVRGGKVGISPKAKAQSRQPSISRSSEDRTTSPYGLSPTGIFSVKNICDVECPMVRVAFTQRRVVYMEGNYANTRGYDYFKLETFGIPMLEVLPSNIRCGDLYRLVESRLRACYKASVSDLIKKKQKLDSFPSDASLKSFTMSSNDDKGADSNGLKKNNVAHLRGAAVDVVTKVQHVSTDEIVGGPIPSKGFTLRLVAGGENFGTACSFCHWLVRCQGCILPDCDDVEYTLRDGESIAVDWHYEVFEELLNQDIANRMLSHPSIAKEKSYIYDKKVPLSSCLDKFSEQESLEGIVCPKCHEDNTLKRNFMLWRLPPILIIQLKRFQFDRIARKKLNQRIDFPIDDLDVAPYVSHTRFESPDAASLCTKYNLCSVIHHVGALGGGHYVATIRDEAGDVLEEGRWHCYNDNLVSEITDVSTVTAPSAYVLFYVRKDVKLADLELILNSDICKREAKKVVVETSSESEGSEEQGEKKESNIPDETIHPGNASRPATVPAPRIVKAQPTGTERPEAERPARRTIGSSHHHRAPAQASKKKDEGDFCPTH